MALPHQMLYSSVGSLTSLVSAKLFDLIYWKGEWFGNSSEWTSVPWQQFFRWQQTEIVCWVYVPNRVKYKNSLVIYSPLAWLVQPCGSTDTNLWMWDLELGIFFQNTHFRKDFECLWHFWKSGWKCFPCLAPESDELWDTLSPTSCFWSGVMLVWISCELNLLSVGIFHTWASFAPQVCVLGQALWLMTMAKGKSHIHLPAGAKEVMLLSRSFGQGNKI